MEYVPNRKLQQNQEDNFWNGVWFIAIVVVICVPAMLYAIQVIFGIPTFSVILGDVPSKMRDKRSAAVAIISAIAILVVISIVYYTRSQGGVSAAGTDAKQTGQRYNPHLTNDVNELRARRIRVNAIRDGMQMHKLARQPPKAVHLPPIKTTPSYLPPDSDSMSTSTPPDANDSSSTPPDANDSSFIPSGEPVREGDIPMGKPVSQVTPL